MVDSSTKVFRLSKRNRLIGAGVMLSFAGLLTAAVIADNGPKFLLFAIPLVVGVPIIFLFSTKLEISREGIKYSDGVLTIAGSWQEIETVFYKGVLMRGPALTYNKWAVPLIWHIRAGVWFEPRFARTIHLGQFERNWLDGEIGKELSQHIPQLVADYRQKGFPAG